MNLYGLFERTRAKANATATRSNTTARVRKSPRQYKIASRPTANCMICGKSTSYTFSSTTICMFVLLLLLIISTLPIAVHGISNNDGNNKNSDENGKIVIGNEKIEMPDAFVNDQQHSNPHFKVNRSTIVHLFEWKFTDVANECETFLGPKGYAGVQLSPVTEHLVIDISTLAHPWWARYYPVSYEITTRSGNKDDFLAMSRACNAAGVRVYVEVVLNHMAGAPNIDGSTMPDPLVGTAGNEVNATQRIYPDVPFVNDDFHKACALQNYMDAHEVRNCELNGRPDLDHSRANVRERIVELLDKLIDFGAAGFYVSAAKHMWPEELKLIFASVKNLNEEFDFPANAKPFFYQEVVDLGTDAISKTEYTPLGAVSEYLYAAQLSIIFNGKAPLSALINWGPAFGFISHQDALVFVDCPAGQRGQLHELGSNYLLTYKQRRKYTMATAFMLAHPYGRVKRIMSSYYYNNNNDNDNDDVAIDDENVSVTDAVNQGPPTIVNDDGNAIVRSPIIDANNGQQCSPESGWVCEHRWPAIVNMISLTNSLDWERDTLINFQTYGSNHIAFCRGHKAFIAINNDPQLDLNTTLHTCLEAGIYCDVVTGGLNSDRTDCIGKRIAVNAEGYANIFVPAKAVEEHDVAMDDSNVNADDNLGVIAIHIDSKLQNGDAVNALATEAQTTNPVSDVNVNADDDTTTPSSLIEVEEITEEMNLETKMSENKDYDETVTIIDTEKTSLHGSNVDFEQKALALVVTTESELAIEDGYIPNNFSVESHVVYEHENSEETDNVTISMDDSPITTKPID